MSKLNDLLNRFELATDKGESYWTYYGNTSPEDAKAELAAIRTKLEQAEAERDVLFDIAVLAMRAVEEMGFVELKGRAQELDHALASLLSDELRERVNTAALKAAK